MTEGEMTMTNTTTTIAATTTDIPRQRQALVTAQWSLSARGSGTVTYHQFLLPGASAPVWPEGLPGARCERREKGGTFLASERRASSLYTFDPLPVGTQRIEIAVRYTHGRKTGSYRTTTTLARYEGGEAIWE